MQIYLQHNKWTGAIEGINVPAGENCSLIDNDTVNKMLQDNMQDYMVFDGELLKKDNVLRVPLEKKFTDIKYGKKATVKLNVYPDEAIIKVIVNEWYFSELTDPFQYDKIQFIHPVLKIFIHSKKSPELLGTLEIDLDEYIKTGKYEQDISTILSKVNIKDLIFKTQRCFEHYAYEILENKTLKSIDRNLIDEDFHIIATYTNNTLKISHNIKYWQEFHYNHNTKIVLSFIDSKNKNALEHYVIFELWQLEKYNSISFDVPKSIATKEINVNVNWLKIKYENTSN